MRLNRNLLAGLASAAWAALLGLAVVPFYLRYLGVEAYGLIGFYVAAQAWMQLLDMGMATTINREVSRCHARGDIHEAGKLLHTLAIVYWAVAAIVAVFMLLGGPLISEYWLQSQQISKQTTANSVMLMGLVLACRWPVGLYQGALIGAQRLQLASGIAVAIVTIGGVGAVGVVKYVSPTLEAFFIWQACVGLGYAYIMRAAAWKAIGRERVAGFDRGALRLVMGFSFGAGAISLAGLALSQLDKVILSKTLTLESFGRYMLAITVANGVYIVVVPVFNIIYPRFSVLVAQHKSRELLREYRVTSQAMAALLFPSAMALTITAQSLVHLWTGNQTLAADLAPLLALLFAAFSLHGVMYVPYALMLAHGNTLSMLKFYVGLIAITAPLTTLLSASYGEIGGGLAQLIQFVSYLLIGSWGTHRLHYKGYALQWLSRDIGIPIGVSLLIGMGGFHATASLRDGNAGVLAELLVAFVLWCIAVLLSFCLLHALGGRMWAHHIAIFKR